MTLLYAEAVKFLADDGWTKANPASFTKENLEVAFDTSHHVEIYALDRKQCLYASPLISAEDFRRFLARLAQAQSEPDS